MTKIEKKLVLFAFLAWLALSSFAYAEKPYSVAFSPADLYLGHVSYVEINNDGQDAVILREGQTVPELASLNSPVGPGDVIRTSSLRRCEIQFDTATVVRLDTDSELKIETILAQTLSAGDRATNLVLSKGGLYIIYKQYDSRELFQVLTPSAAIKFGQDTVAFVKNAADGATVLQVKRGKATALYGPSAARAKGVGIKKLEGLIVSKDGLIQKADYAPDAYFARWNEEINATFDELHKGLSYLPDPVLRYSPGIVAWAQKYSSRYGQWIYDRLYGYVWRPDTNDIYPWRSLPPQPYSYPWISWQPYLYGHWVRAYDQMFWVSDEPWGWVPYHLGIWVWDKELGWLWIPGSVFASAWVGWQYMFGYYAWWPFGFYDWWWEAYGYFGPFWDLAQGQYGYNQYYPLYDRTIRKVSKDQLKKPGPRWPLPGDLKPVYNRILAALKNKDSRLVALLEQSANRVVFVRPADIHARNIAEKAVPRSQVPSASELSNGQPNAVDKMRLEHPLVAAAWDWRRNIQQSAAKDPLRQVKEPASKLGPIPAAVVSPKAQVAAGRFLDWNPDLRTVARLGGTIRYSSRTNEVQCPELGLTSRTGPILGLSHFGREFMPGRGGHSLSSSSGSMMGSGASSSGGQGSGQPTGSSQSGSGSSSGGSHGHTKKD